MGSKGASSDSAAAGRGAGLSDLLGVAEVPWTATGGGRLVTQPAVGDAFLIL